MKTYKWSPWNKVKSISIKSYSGILPTHSRQNDMPTQNNISYTLWETESVSDYLHEPPMFEQVILVSLAIDKSQLSSF